MHAASKLRLLTNRALPLVVSVDAVSSVDATTGLAVGDGIGVSSVDDVSSVDAATGLAVGDGDVGARVGENVGENVLASTSSTARAETVTDPE